MDFKSTSLTCKLTTPELQKRRETVIRNIKELALRQQEMREGLRLTFAASDEVVDTVLVFIKTERLCCDFLDFQLSVHKSEAVLEITGPSGTGEFLKHELGL